MSEKHSKNSGLKELFLESLASKPQLPKKSADQSLPIVLAFLEELLDESQSEQEAEEPKKPLQDQA